MNAIQVPASLEIMYGQAKLGKPAPALASSQVPSNVEAIMNGTHLSDPVTSCFRPPRLPAALPAFRTQKQFDDIQVSITSLTSHCLGSLPCQLLLPMSSPSS